MAGVVGRREMRLGLTILGAGLEVPGGVHAPGAAATRGR